jgi:hypothetical protein
MTTSKKQYNHPTLEVIELDSIVSLQPTSETTGPDPGEFPDPPGTTGDGRNRVEGGKTGNSELKSNSFSETPFK